jgi:hypothetical protein
MDAFNAKRVAGGDNCFISKPLNDENQCDALRQKAVINI